MADLNELQALIGKYQQQVSADAPTTIPEKIMGYSRSYLQGPTFGFADELEAALAAPFTGRTYKDELSTIQGQQAYFKNKTDYLDNAAELAGSIFANPIGLFGKAASGLSGLGRSIFKIGTSVPAQSALYAVGSAGQGEDLLKAAGKGAAIGTAGSIGASVIGGTFQEIEKGVSKLKLSAFGISPAAIRKAFKKSGWVPNAAEELPLVNTIEKLNKVGIIKPDNGPTKNLVNIMSAQRAIAGGIDDQTPGALDVILKQADTALPAVPDFARTNTEKYINSFSGKARELARESADEEISAIRSQFVNGGSIEDLQRAKLGLNYKWIDSPMKNSVAKEIRSDLRAEIEDRIERGVELGVLPKEVSGKVRDLNREWGDMAELADALKAKVGSEFGSNMVEDIMGIFGPQGSGYMHIMSAAQDSPLWSALNIAGNVARTNAGKDFLADLLGGFKPAFQAAGNLLRGEAGIPGIGTVPAPITGASTIAGYNAWGAADKPAPQKPASATLDEIRSLINKYQKKNLTNQPMPKTSDEIASLLQDAVIHQESRGKPKAVSHKGAVGLMQVMPSTAREIARELGVETYDLTDPETNKRFGMHYLKKMLDMFDNDPKLALAAYNAGPGAVQKWISRWGTKDWDTLSAKLKDKGSYLETVNYVPAIMKNVILEA